MNQDRFEKEIQRIKHQYQFVYDKKFRRTHWSPFLEKEAAYRSQQFLSFAFLMSKIDRFDLTGWRILDVGCGRGRLLRSFLDMGAQTNNLFGIDIREEDISEARAISPALNFSVSHGNTLDFPENQFDLVTQFVVFSSILMPELRQQLADEMWRVLKPGGYIFWWDLKKIISSKEVLNPSSLFPKENFIAVISVGAKPKPSETLSSFPGMKILGKCLDCLRKSPTHVAALIGPKPLE